jgi:transcriptional regulator with XRE-family HTH domain
MGQSIAGILYLLRSERGYSQRRVASDLGVSQALLSHYENGIREPKLDFIVRVCGYYDVSADYILGRADERKSMVLQCDTEEHRRVNSAVGRIMEALERMGEEQKRGDVARYFAIVAENVAEILEDPNGRYDPIRDAEQKIAEAALRGRPDIARGMAARVARGEL